MRIRHIFMFGLPDSKIWYTLPHKQHNFRKTNLLNTKCFDFLYKYCLKYFSFYEELNEIWSNTYIGLLVTYLLSLSDFNESLTISGGTRWCNGWGTALQTGRSRVRFPVVSLDFLIGIILPAAIWPWGQLNLQQNWVPGIFPGGKSGRCVGLTTLPP
jgi:hypothetical protein